MPIEQQVVVVEHVVRSLGVDVGQEQPFEVVGVLRAPGERLGQNRFDLLPRVHAAAVDVQAGPLLRETAVVAGQAQFRAGDVQQILCIPAVHDGEAWVKADSVSVPAQ